MRVVSVADSILLTLVQTSRSEGGYAALDEHALAEFLRAIEASGYRTPDLCVYSDGSIECAGHPVNASGKVAELIRAIHRHGAITRDGLSREVWGDAYQTPANIRTHLLRARNALSLHGLTIVNLPGDQVTIQKKTKA